MPCCAQGVSWDPEPLWEVTQLEQEGRDLSCPVAEGCLPALLLACGEDLSMLLLPCCMWVCGGELPVCFYRRRYPAQKNNPIKASGPCGASVSFD